MGAWIETCKVLVSIIVYYVAPYVGAWIETFARMAKISGSDKVAPYVGAWIETWQPQMPSRSNLFQSYPTWVRGLKHQNLELFDTICKSHPTWVRGLKLNIACANTESTSRTLRGCVD